jgi:mono/diheme cytochrome c family protein
MPLIRIKQANWISAKSRGRLAVALALGLVLMPLAAHADEETRSRPLTSLSMGFRFTETTGEELFASACQGCHMPDGKGAVGAGAYPSLVQDSNLEAGGYPVYVVVRGQRAMPALGAMMSDAQVAAVVNYVRTHFGNQYRDAVSADDVKLVRPGK